MANIAQLLTEHMDIWTAAETEKKSGRGRANGNGSSVYGVKKLRELILELAVRGKLVPQDSNDEPASELLKRIKAEKAKLIAEGKIKKEKPLLLVGDDEKPFELPKGWEWTRLGNIQSFTNGYAFKSPEFQNSGIGVIRIGDVGNDGSIATDSMLFFPYERKTEIPDKFIVKPGDLVISMTGNVKLAFNKSNDIFFINQRVGKIEPHLISKFYLYRYLSTVAQEKIDNASGGVIPNVSTEEINETLIPLPPLAEQQRIAAKVDELMALCDQLEQQHSNAQQAHETLVSQLLATLTQSQNATEFNANWQRIDAHFDLLFTTEASIDALKQTLLQLAVMGKLVPQEPDDEPASELLKRIQAEKARLIAEGKLKKEKPLAPISEDEKPFELPQGWGWVRLNALLTKIGAGSTPLGGKQVYVQDGVPFLRSQNIWDDGLRLDDVAYITTEIHQKMSGTHVVAGDLLFNITGASIGRCAIVPDGFETGNVSQHVTIIRLINKESLRFIHLVLISKHVQQTVMDVQVGVSREGLSIGKLGQFVIPIPPLAEQHRIVAKVEALMALCDQLKTRLQQAGQQQQAIADALVAQAVQ